MVNFAIPGEPKCLVPRNLISYIRGGGFRKEGSYYIWLDPKQRRISLKDARRGVLAVLNDCTRRDRFKVEESTEYDDAYIVTRLRGIRPWPKALEHLKLKRHYASDKEHIDALKRRVEFLQLPRSERRLVYTAPGRRPSLQDKSRFGWANLEVGDVMTVYCGSASVIHNSFRSWAEARELSDAKITTSKVDKGSYLVARVS